MSQSLVGRESECAALRVCLMATMGQVIFVSGEAGAGKTTLVEHALADTFTATGRADEWAGTAYDILARALRPLGADGPGVLAQILPELGPPPKELSPAALAAAVCALLEAAAGSDPAVLFLDDLQWADEASLGLLPALSDAAQGRRIAVVGCYRSDELARDHRLRVVRALLRRKHQLTEIKLGRLTDGDVGRMLTSLLSAEPTPDLVAAVAERADGLPFAVEELASALRDGGHLARQGESVALTDAGAPAVPTGIRDAVMLRTSRLPEAERALLEAAAVAGNEFDVDAVLAASGVTSWPDGFTGSGVLSEATDGRAAFRHALSREAVYTDIPWLRRRRLHRALAGVLADGGAAPASIAAHLVAARDFTRARPALLAAAERYCAVHAYRDGARVLRTALEHWPEEEEGRIAAVDQLARCAEMCSDYAEAVVLLRDLADSYQSRGDLSALAGTNRRLALVHEMSGHWEPALAAREAAAAASAAVGRPADAATDRLAAATHLRSAASFSAALATLDAAEEEAAASGRLDLRCRIQGLRGNVLARLGEAANGLALLRAALGQALAASLPEVAAELQQRLADALEHSGDYAAATAAYASAYQYCDAHGANAIGQLCRAFAAPFLFSSGEWDRAGGVCEDLFVGAGPLHARAVASGMLGLVHALRGDARRARPLLLECRVIATRIELTAMELYSCWGLYLLADATGLHEGAVDRARQILVRLARTQERHYSVQILQWTATFFAEAGLPDDARACAAALSVIAEATGQPEAIAALAHARGETMLADEPRTAARELRRAAEMFGQLKLPLATALAERRAAAAAMRIGDAGHAGELLRAAHETADRLGARRLREACVTELDLLGAKPRRRRPLRASTGLTTREMDVMLLVAGGNTSPQIGTTLFISPRTVEMHVHNSMLKLGCRTRAEAVGRLAELHALGPIP